MKVKGGFPKDTKRNWKSRRYPHERGRREDGGRTAGGAQGTRGAGPREGAGKIRQRSSVART